MSVTKEEAEKKKKRILNYPGLVHLFEVTDERYARKGETSGSTTTVVSGDYLTKMNPTGIGAFSLNRKEDTTVAACSVAVGNLTTASGYCSNAEGYMTTASGSESHAEGRETVSSGYASHSEGWQTTASGKYSHSEGRDTIASGEKSHAEGYGTKATGDASHAGGVATVAQGYAQYVIGCVNIPDTTSAVIVGNGTGTGNESNAFTLDWNGNAVFAGTVTANGKVLGSGGSGTASSDLVVIDDEPIVVGTTKLQVAPSDSEEVSLVTEDELEAKGYLTEGSFNGYVTETELDGKGYITETDLSGKNYTTMTSVEAKGYTTMTEVEAKGYTTMTEVEAKGYLEESDKDSIAQDIYTLLMEGEW